MKHYIYRFLDKNSKVIYVGKTKKLSNRIRQHFKNGHLPSECYEMVEEVQYIALNSPIDASIKELFYINYFKPTYNKMSKYNEGELTINLDVSEDDWQTFHRSKLVKKKKLIRPTETGNNAASEKIRKLLYVNKNTISDLANLLNVSPNNFSNKLRRGNFKEKDIRQIAKVCNAKLEINFILEDGTKI